MVSVKAADGGARAVGSLSDVWVLLDDVPSGLRTSSTPMAFGELLGKPIEVESTSLDRLGPARMKILCLDPTRVQGPVDVFPTSCSYRIRVWVEGQAAQQAPPPSPPNPSHAGRVFVSKICRSNESSFLEYTGF